MRSLCVLKNGEYPTKVLQINSRSELFISLLLNFFLKPQWLTMILLNLLEKLRTETLLFLVKKSMEN